MCVAPHYQNACFSAQALEAASPHSRKIIGGVILGPSALGRSEVLTPFSPRAASPYFDSVANIGLLFLLFLVRLVPDSKKLRGPE